MLVRLVIGVLALFAFGYFTSIPAAICLGVAVFALAGGYEE